MILMGDINPRQFKNAKYELSKLKMSDIIDFKSDPIIDSILQWTCAMVDYFEITHDAVKYLQILSRKQREIIFSQFYCSVVKSTCCFNNAICNCLTYVGKCIVCTLDGCFKLALSKLLFELQRKQTSFNS